MIIVKTNLQDPSKTALITLQQALTELRAWSSVHPEAIQTSLMAGHELHTNFSRYRLAEVTTMAMLFVQRQVNAPSLFIGAYSTRERAEKAAETFEKASEHQGANRYSVREYVVDAEATL